MTSDLGFSVASALPSKGHCGSPRHQAVLLDVPWQFG